MKRQRFIGGALVVAGVVLSVVGGAVLISMSTNGVWVLLLFILLAVTLAAVWVRCLAPVPEPITIQTVYRFNRVARFIEPGGPRKLMPRHECLGPVLNLGIQRASVDVAEMLSRDRVVFEVQADVIFRFDPRNALPNYLEELVAKGNTMPKMMVGRQGRQALLSLIGERAADELMLSTVREQLAEDVKSRVAQRLSDLGVTVVNVTIPHLLPTAPVREVLRDQWLAEHRAAAAVDLAKPLFALLAGQSADAAEHLEQALLAVRMQTEHDPITAMVGSGSVVALGGAAGRTN